MCNLITATSIYMCLAHRLHLKAVLDQGGKKASKKRKQAFEWRYRLVNKEVLKGHVAFNALC